MADTIERRVVRDLLRGLRAPVACFLLLGLLTTACVQSGPLLVAWAIDHSAGSDGIRSAALAAGGFLGLNAVGALLSASQIRLASRLSESVLSRLRERLYAHVFSLDARFFERTSDGAVISRMTSDVEVVAMFLRSGLVMAITNVFVLIVTTVFLFVLSPLLAAIVLLIVAPLAIVGTRSFLRRARQVNDELRLAVAETGAEINEGIRGIAVVRRFGRGADQLDRFGRLNHKRLDAAARSYRGAAIYSAGIDAVGVLAYVPVILIGALLLDRGAVSAGVVVGFVVYVGSFFEPVQSLTQILAQAQAARSAFGRTVALLAETAEPGEPDQARPLPVSGRLRMRDVTFSYSPDLPPVLEHFDLEVPAGQRLALVGTSGAGKTTVARLLSRSLWPVGGQVTFGGVDLLDVTTPELRSRIVTVSQEGHLFAGSVQDNLDIVGSAATADAVAGMLGQLRALGVDPPAGTDPSSARLSAGQRQLVSLGRALLLDPAVLILDEATADVDEDTARAVDDLLSRLPDDRTVIVVAHRIETAQRLARVIVIEDGQAVEDGDPAALAVAGQTFQRLLESQRADPGLAQAGER